MRGEDESQGTEVGVGESHLLINLQVFFFGVVISTSFRHLIFTHNKEIRIKDPDP